MTIFGTQFSSCLNLARPLLLKLSTLVSCYFFTLVLWLFCFDIEVTNEPFIFSQAFQLIFVFSAICVSFISFDFLKSKNITKFEYDILFSFVVFSGLCLSLCQEFLLVYLVIELLSLTLYLFATFNRNSELSTEAGLKYFIFGSIMSCFLLFGFSIIYHYLGSLSFEALAAITDQSTKPLFYCSFISVLIVLLFKVGSAPFHF